MPVTPPLQFRPLLFFLLCCEDVCRPPHNPCPFLCVIFLFSNDRLVERQRGVGFCLGIQDNPERVGRGVYILMERDVLAKNAFYTFILLVLPLHPNWQLHLQADWDATRTSVFEGDRRVLEGGLASSPWQLLSS